VVAAVSALAGCAALEPARPVLPRAPVFDLVGRVAVTHDGRSFSSGMRWQHAPDRDEIWLLTPLGQALAHIVDDAEGAVYTGSDRRQYRARDVEALTRRTLGWELPVARLAWWVRGDSAADGVIAEVERDPQNRLLRLRQDGWDITYVYRSQDSADSLPQRLDLRSESQSIRLVIDTWRQDAVGDGPTKSSLEPHLDPR
jgi:outer membrane lipoprotein LolB